MAAIVNYGVGIDYSATNITGKKSTFSPDEKIYAGHYWTGLGRDQKLSIIFAKKLAIGWDLIHRSDWKTPTWDKEHFQVASLTDKTPGEWEARFLLDDGVFRTFSFTITGVAPPAPPGYPKDITRAPYTISVDNAEQETYVKDFLGIEPAGVDLDTYVSKLDLTGLEEWRDYWIDKFRDIGMSFWITFVEDKFNEYKEKLEPPEKTWWEKLLEFVISPIIPTYTFDKLLFQQGYKLLTDKEMSDAEYELNRLKLADWILPINTLLILFEGKNLKGEPAEFGAWQYADLAATALMFIPIGKLGKIGAKVSAKTGGKGLLGVAEKMALKKATPAQINAILKSGNFKYVMSAIRKEPALWAKIMPHLDDPTRAVLFASMKKMSDPTSYRLAAESVKTFEAAKGLSLWQKAFGALPGKTKARKVVISITTVLGSIAAYIGLAQFLAHTGREAIADAVGFGAIWTNIDAGNWEAAATYLPLYKSAIDSYEKSTTLASTIPFLRGIWEDAIESIKIAYEAEKELIETEIAKIGKTGTLKITTEPADAKITVEGQFPATGVFDQELKVGEYYVTVTAFQLEPQSFTVEIKEGETVVKHIILTKEPVVELPEEVRTTVRDIIDGDTIDVSLDVINSDIKLPEYGTTGHARIRIVGINAPEKSPKGEILCTDIEVYQVQKSWADESKNILLPLNDKIVKLYIDPENDVDIHGRILAKVEFEGKDVGLEQIKRGLACWYFREKNKYVDDEIYKAATLSAQENKTGMWSDLPEQPGLPPEAKITFSIDSTPSNAPVFIDGIATHHNTPTDNMEQEDVWGLWAEGKHILKITKSGMVKEVEIDLIPGEHLELVVDLTALPEEPELPEVECQLMLTDSLKVILEEEAPEVLIEPKEDEFTTKEIYLTALARFKKCGHWATWTPEELEEIKEKLEEPPEPEPPPEPVPETFKEILDKFLTEVVMILGKELLDPKKKELEAEVTRIIYEGTQTPIEPPIPTEPKIPAVYTTNQLWALTTAFSDLWDLVKGAAQLSAAEFNIFKASYDMYSDEQKKVLDIFFSKVWHLTKGAAQMSHDEYKDLMEEFHI